MAPHDPQLPYILPSDRNCAVSSPNSLLGSRYGPAQDRPTITVNATAASLQGLDAFFGLHSLSIKPIALPVDPLPVIANVTIRGWTADGEGGDDPLVFRVGWTSGYSEPLTVHFGRKHFSVYRWEKIVLLDFSVEYGPDELDWEFCLDNLRVGFRRCQGRPCLDNSKHVGRKPAEGMPGKDL